VTFTRYVLRALVLLSGFWTFEASAHLPHVCPAGVVDVPGMTKVGHFEQQDMLDALAAGTMTFQDIFIIGGAFAEVDYNACDGQGRPATTGDGQKRMPGQPRMIRTSGPEANSCFGCHAQPRAGGSGDFVANTFNGAENLDPVTDSIDPSLSNERGTTGMFGAGYIELLGNEMTAELKSQAKTYKNQGYSGNATLSSKGVDFKVKFEDGKVKKAWGIDTDLIVKPFGSGGTVSSLRQFTVQAFNRHHGMQAEESYDIYRGDPDFDEDGITRELTIGDISAITLWQAMLDRPVQEIPDDDPELADAIARGQSVFNDVGCTSCHIKKMTLNNRTFCTPSSYTPPEIYGDKSKALCVILDYDELDTRKYDDDDPSAPPADEPLKLRTLTDLKRHAMCDDPETVADPIRTLCNEHHDEGRPKIGNVPGAETFMTADLWQMGESGPFGHNGRFNSVSSIVLAHAGEARASRDAFAALSSDDQLAVIQYLKSLKLIDQIVRLNDG